MLMQEYIDQAERDLLHTYNRYQVVFDHGKGMRLFDIEGKSYLDFVAGIAVFALGYGDEKYNSALKDQMDRIIHTSNYYYNMPAIEAARRIKEHTSMDRVFFTNSGAEAVEGAIKAARKYAYRRDGRTDHEIIALEHSFHGRTFGALSVTGNSKYREPFEPMIGGIRFATLNDIDSIKAQLTDRTCAVILESIQGEGGIRPADESFLKEIRKICDERDMLLILDEIQCGMGRTGDMFVCRALGVEPDILTTAKALGCGVPVGAFVLNRKAGEASLEAGDHGTTYGGNPLACTAINAVFDRFEELGLTEHVKKTAPYLESKLDALKEKYDFITDRRGKGFMQGLEFDRPVAPFINAALEKGLVLINAGSNIIRFVPPLIAEKSDIDEMADILDACLEEKAV